MLQSRMPTAKKKLGGMGLFMRQGDGTVNGPGSPKAGGGGGVGSPVTPATGANVAVVAAAGASHAQLQPPPEIVASRQELAAAARLPVPRSGRFSTNTSQQQQQQQQQQQAAVPAATTPATQLHLHPIQRTRTTASDHIRGTSSGRNGAAAAWEDSTVASMFGAESESRAGSERYPGLHSRHYSETAHHRPQQFQFNHGQAGHDENLPFIIGDNGLLKVVHPPNGANGPSASTLNTSLSSIFNLVDPQPAEAADLYQDPRPAYETSPSKNNALRHTKLAHRDGKTNLFSERPGGHRPLETASVGMSPGRASEAGDQIERFRLEERNRKRREAELQHKRSTVFEHPGAAENQINNFNNTRAAVGVPSSEPNTEDFKQGPLPETPRAARKGPAVQKRNNSMPRESSVGRTVGRRANAKEPSRKRQHSPDYNDAELHAMSYSDLRSQSFDFDPQTAVLQQTGVPLGGTLQEKLEHYKDKDSIDQHQFFTRISVQEWEDAGDWLLERFSGVMHKMREARRAKRRMVERFEGEIAAREQAVRGKIEYIGRTLEDLKQEGQTMMEGKDMDLDV